MDEALKRYLEWLAQRGIRVGLSDDAAEEPFSGRDLAGAADEEPGVRRADLGPAGIWREETRPDLGLAADHATRLTAQVLWEDRESLRGKTACEVGCGTGLLSALLASVGAEVHAADLFAEAVELTERNASRNGVRVRGVCGNLLEPFPPGRRFDAVVANLPQKPVPPAVSLSSAEAGGEEGTGLLLPFLSGAAKRLSPGGRLYMFLHSLPDPAVWLTLQEEFDPRIRRWEKRYFTPEEFGPTVSYWEERRREGKCWFEREGDRFFWICLAVAAKRR